MSLESKVVEEEIQKRCAQRTTPGIELAQELYNSAFLYGATNAILNTNWRDSQPNLDAAARFPVDFNRAVHEGPASLSEELINIMRERNNWTRSAILMERRDYRDKDFEGEGFDRREDYEKKLVVVAETGYPSSARYHSFPITQGHAGEAFVSGRTMYKPDISLSGQYHRIVDDSFVSGSEVAVPIVNGETSGVLVVSSPEIDGFCKNSFRLLSEYGKQVGTIIDKINDINLDQLTKLWTRNRFESDFTRNIFRTRTIRRNKQTNADMGLVLLDVSFLKYVNDMHDNHHSGDLLLETVGQTISEIIRTTDHAYRIGGDEFAIVLTGTKPINVQAFAEERLRPRLKQNVYDLAKIRGMDLPYEDPVGIGYTTIHEFFTTGRIPTPSHLRDATEQMLYLDKGRIKDKLGKQFAVQGR